MVSSAFVSFTQWKVNTAHIIVCQDTAPTYGPLLTNFIFSFWKLPLKQGWESENPTHTVLIIPLICEIVIGTCASWVHAILKHLPTLTGDSGSVCWMLVQTARGHTHRGRRAAEQLHNALCTKMPSVFPPAQHSCMWRKFYTWVIGPYMR